MCTFVSSVRGQGVGWPREWCPARRHRGDVAWQSRYLAWHLCCPVLLGEGKNGVIPGEKGVPKEGCWLSNPPRAPYLLGESGHGGLRLACCPALAWGAWSFQEHYCCSGTLAEAQVL